MAPLRFTAPRVHCRTFPLHRAGFTVIVGAPPRTPGTPPHPRHDGRFIAERFRCRAFIAPRRFAPSNVGAPPRTPGTPPHPRHDGRFIAARSWRCMFIAAWNDAARFRCAGSRCALPGTGRHEWRPYGSPRRAFIAARLHCTAPVHTVNVGAPLVTPGTPP